MISFELDVHTHTVASGHYTKDTLTDMVRYASKTGLKLLGISEHGPAIPHSCCASYFRGLSLAPSMRMGVRMLYGAEVNIMDFSGSVDLPEDIIEELDYCIAGMHLPCLTPGTTDQNTNAYVRAMQNPHIHIIAHPDDVKYPVDYKCLVEAAIDNHVLLEINNSSLSPGGYRGNIENVQKNDRTVLELCRKYRHPILLSSDSHGHAGIGNFSYAYALAQETHFPEELILNYSVEKFLRFLSAKKEIV